MSDKRRKGVAIVDTDKGILVVAGRGKRFILRVEEPKNGKAEKRQPLGNFTKKQG